MAEGGSNGGGDKGTSYRGEDGSFSCEREKWTRNTTERPLKRSNFREIRLGDLWSVCGTVTVFVVIVYFIL